jgi:hypothetical protein
MKNKLYKKLETTYSKGIKCKKTLKIFPFQPMETVNKVKQRKQDPALSAQKLKTNYRSQSWSTCSNHSSGGFSAGSGRSSLGFFLLY